MGSYYPFGLKHRGYNNVTSSNGNSVAQKFGYNGIELEESLGLNLHEMDFRQYDASIGRFTSIDPVTHHSMSTYTAFDNNPVYWADPSGADATSYINDIWNKTPNDGRVHHYDGDGNSTGSSSVDDYKKAASNVYKVGRIVNTYDNILNESNPVQQYAKKIVIVILL
ncbi:RHS repeat-associated core domain-containing protein [Polaribacter porphyrae]|uniref:RHS repeat-associated core domain-containing protein n=1 Tax=Polaribacter porphyrae TaxID=1137780 RepID=A0A2S7WRU1_9FLAO|nr:RHS repeat-associated core domain-containing protein [Polaribacter porphyrae]PQJ80317.1 hypothetical protein BTO18_14535 [Polaribacter porphyrae]